MLNFVMFISDGLKCYNNKPENVPVIRKLIALAEPAHKNYKLYLENLEEKAAQEEKNLMKKKH